MTTTSKTPQARLDAAEIRERARGRWPEILTAVGGVPPEILDGKHHPCPRCGGTDRFRFIDPDAGALFCNVCFNKANGDGFSAVMWLLDCTFPEALRAVGEYLGEPARPTNGRRAKSTTAIAKRIWDESKLDTGRVSAYLRSRGLSGSVPRSVRFHGSLEYRDGDSPPQRYPGLVARVGRDGKLAGIQRIYLDPSGTGKAAVKDCKKGLGELRGGAVRLGEPEPGGTLAITEGIETGLAVQETTGTPVWAAVSAVGMETIEVPDTVGCIELWTDNDENSRGQQAGQKAAARLHALGHDVVIITPPEPGTDWLDVTVSDGPAALAEASAGAREWEPAPEPKQEASEGNGQTSSAFALGDWVTPSDLNNKGRITAMSGNTAVVHFVAPNGNEADKTFRLSELRKLDGTGGEWRTAAPHIFPVVRSEDFAAKDYRPEWFIKGRLAKKQNGVLGGPAKCLKTCVALDASVSVSTGTLFLGEYETAKANVAIFSGESGPYVLQRNAKQICRERGLLLSQTSIFWCFELPQVGCPEHLAGLARLIADNGIELAFIDPAYLSLLAGTQGLQASNVFAMGPLLLGLTDVARETDSAIVLLHHTRKNLAEPFAPLDLETLAMAGFAEWSRQWWLLNRRAPYVDGTGQHELWFRYGGSYGHGGCLALDIDEGSLHDDFTA